MSIFLDHQEQQILYWRLGCELTATEAAEQLQLSPAEYALILQNIRNKLKHGQLIAQPRAQPEMLH